MITIEKLYTLFRKSNGVSTDSRNIAPGSIFFALKGDTFDGNSFVLQALESGAAYAVSDDKSLPDNSRIIKTDDSLKTLQQLAAHHRVMLGLPVFALTGTNGKTTTKELITTVLSTKYKVVSTTGNLNNHIGVPLTLLKMNEETEMAVIEMGASAPGEIELLCSICQPNSGLITNVGKAHLLGFGSFEGVKKTKGELYDYLNKNGGTALYNGMNSHLCEMISQRTGINKIEYGLNAQNALVLKATSDNPFLRIELNGTRIINTNMIGDYNADNVLAALAVGAFAGTDPDLSVKAVEAYIPSNNRSQLVKGQFNTLIVDAYNANPTSMKAALDNFMQIECSKRALIIGDMLELGEYSSDEHKGILELIKHMNTESLFFVGSEFKNAADGDSYFAERAKFFQTSDLLKEHLNKSTPKGCTFLIKGSRGTRLEKVIEAL
jgi:UDP-N-acetylmuramoyl-tripeptide--D-alanyl-D-alanine ligase